MLISMIYCGVILTGENSEDLQRGTARSSAIVEVRQYVNEAYISRRDNPLLWWKKPRKCLYSFIQDGKSAIVYDGYFSSL